MKFRFLAFVCLSFLMTRCETSSNKETNPSTSSAYTENYLPAVFTDLDRVSKIKANVAALDKIFKTQFSQGHFPGMAYGIVVDDKLIYSNSFGSANIDLKIDANANTGFRIASMTKSFTAMAILKLRDEGKLRLTDPASIYIKEMNRLTRITKDAPDITIEDLMTMSAGFPEDNPWGDRQLADTDKELTDFIASGISFSNAPGLEYEYSNLGFGMLGLIITSVSGKPYQQYINENIIRPLGMNDTKWEFTEVPARQFAMGYRWEKDSWKEEPILHDGIFGAMGGLICSVNDFSKYVAFHLSAWPSRNDDESDIIKRSSLREMHQLQRFGGLQTTAKSINGGVCPIVAGYGYGLGYRRNCEGTVAIRHGGGLPGYGSEWRILPDYGIGIVSLSNLTYGGLSGLNARALDTLIMLAKLSPRELPVSEILQKRRDDIVELIQAWPDKKLNLLAENFLLDFSLDLRKETSEALLRDAGKIINVGKVVPENQLRGSFIIECEKNNIEVFFTLTPEKIPLLQQLDMELVKK